MSILVLGDPLDPHILSVTKELSSRGADFYVLDIWHPWESIGIFIEQGQPIVRIEGVDVAFNNVWCRWKPHVGDTAEAEAFALRERREFILGLLEVLPLRNYINDPWQQDRSRNKILQLLVARNVGLTIPVSWISNDADAVVHASRIRRMIYKPLSWLATVDGKLLFTNEVTQDELLLNREAISVAPGIFQELIPKRCEYRITIMDRQFFSVRIYSQERPETMLDWRRNQSNLRYEQATLPKEIEEKLGLLMTSLKLRYAAIDMIETDADHWIFLEANPGGNWLWLEERTQIPISNAIVEALISSD